MGEKAFGGDRKKEKSQRKKLQQEQFMQDFQFNRALGNVFNGMPIEDIMDLAPENIVYVVKHIGGHERAMDEFTTEMGSETPTIVKFTRSKPTISPTQKP